MVGKFLAKMLYEAFSFQEFNKFISINLIGAGNRNTSSAFILNGALVDTEFICRDFYGFSKAQSILVHTSNYRINL